MPSSLETSPVTPQAGPAPGPVPSALLQEKLRGLRRRHVAVALVSGLALSTVVSLELASLALFADWALELPWGVRLISLLFQASLLIALLGRLVILPWWRQPDEDSLALMVERALPEFRTRLIASVQLARPGAVPVGASPALAQALIEETESVVRPVDFRRIVPTDRLRKFGAMAVVVPLMGLLGFAAAREVGTDLLRRLFLSHVPVPRKTRIVVANPSRVVGIGDTVLLEAFTRGLRPRHGEVEITFRSRRTQSLSVDEDRDQPLHFGRVVENVQESFSYRFRLGDGHSGVCDVLALPRPTLATVECEQTFPAYTGLKPMRRNLGDLTLLAGSTLRLRATTTKPVQRAALKLAGMNQALPVTLGLPERRELTGEILIPVKGLSGFQVDMVDTDDMESRDSAVYRIDILPDKIPIARLTYPDRKEELVTRVATLLLAFEASDDFRIAAARLKYKTGAVDSGAEKAIELELDGQSPQRLRRRYEWKLTETMPSLPEGTLIEYWIEVVDNNDATGPGIGVSEHQLAKVVSEAEKRADLLNRAGDYLGSISEVAADQEKLNQKLGAIIRAKAGL